MTLGGSSVLSAHKGGETKRFPLSQMKLAVRVVYLDSPCIE